ncbi:uncharacterized protein LOC109823971 [Asparagus officinalis]|uniref:uncharacterized protein LOC109823971 n=1 Tax=Asparagus officinalis TaxID=4686 RepID=UPI00098E56D5|nr:uncharacterized protein LOC109823971 [Asparagus officinalis]
MVLHACSHVDNLLSSTLVSLYINEPAFLSKYYIFSAWFLKFAPCQLLMPLLASSILVLHCVSKPYSSMDASLEATCGYKFECSSSRDWHFGNAFSLPIVLMSPVKSNVKYSMPQ